MSSIEVNPFELRYKKHNHHFGWQAAELLWANPPSLKLRRIKKSASYQTRANLTKDTEVMNYLTMRWRLWDMNVSTYV